MPPTPPDSRMAAWIVFVMLAMVAVPAGITLHTVHSPAVAQITSPNPTPYGYTWSLLLFVVPIMVIGGWFLPSEGVRISKRAFWRTIWLLVPIGCGLDFFLASRLFTFPNPNATIGLNPPVVGGTVPVEEYVFYFTGFLAVLLLYIWLDEYWLSAYKVPKHANDLVKARRLLQFHASSLIVGIALVLLALTYKKFRSPYPDGFPTYFAVLVFGGMVPSAIFFRVARQFINWRAISLTMFMLLLISMFWEATLAVPYGWWGYQQKQMMGLFIGAWSQLPVEAVFVWMAVTYGAVIVYEVLQVWQASGEKARHAFLGKPAALKKSAAD